MDRATEQPEPRGEQTHRFLRAAWITAALVVATISLNTIVATVTASPLLCSSCHEIKPSVERWRTSPHATVTCQECHEDPLEWYQYAQKMTVRAARLERDLRSHFNASSETTPDLSANGRPVPDENCLQCHTPDREVTSDEGTLIDHPTHARENGSCISCHIDTGHPNPDVDAGLMFMAQCFTCHGTDEMPEAEGDCAVCHPASYELEPESHAPTTWQADHGRSALGDRATCLMCHDAQTCLDCHGVEMPHPEGWVDEPPAHSVVATTERQACETCHSEGPDFCTTCHHPAYKGKRGTWVEQHPDEANRAGAADCFQCHAPTFCVDCHTLVEETGGD